MSDNLFVRWLTDPQNNLFLKEPLASEKFDDLSYDPELWASIVDNKQNRETYNLIEQQICSEYAFLIDYKLREVFYTLTEEEFKNPKGFECRLKSSFRQNNYFVLTEHLEFFVKSDIQNKADHPLARLNAFKRWIEISNILFNQYCYEGFFLIFTNLQTIARDDILNALPKKSLEQYKSLATLCKVSGNFHELRSLILQNMQHNIFPPLVLWFRDLRFLNETIEKANNAHKELITALEALDLKIEQTNSNTDLNLMFELIQQKDLIYNQYWLNRILIIDQTKRIDAILEEIKKAQITPLNKLPIQLEQSYKRIELRFNQYQLDQARTQYIDQTIASEFALFIDVKLREVLRNINSAEFGSPQSFNNKVKPSIGKQSYLDLREQLQFFIAHDIKMHSTNEITKLNVIERWIEISDNLLKRHCYEGFIIIFKTLQNTPFMLDKLFPNSLNKYNSLDDLCDAKAGYATLKTYINTNYTKGDLIPLKFWNSRLARINKAMIELVEEQRNIQLNLNQLNAEITDPSVSKTSEEINGLVKSRLQLTKQLEELNKDLDNKWRQSNRLLKEIKAAQKRTLESIPIDINKHFLRSKSLFYREQMIHAKSIKATKNSNEPNPMYKIKSQLSFWSLSRKKHEEEAGTNLSLTQ